MTPAPHRQELESTSPEEAVELYRREKEAEGIRQSTLDNLKYSFTPFLEWADEQGLDNMNNLTPKLVHDYKLYLQERRNGGYAPSTLEAYLCDFRAMVEHAESYGGVQRGLSDVITVPSPSGENSRKHIVLEESRAEAISEYLNKYEYASRRHVEFQMIWDCGLRIGALRSLDMDDFVRDDPDFSPHLRLMDRPNQGTGLKNGAKSERRVFVRPETEKVLKAWITDRRPEAADEFGRKPLLTTQYGRVSEDAIKKDMQRATAPCFLGNPCEGCNGDDHNKKCPEALSPHPIRRGAITRDLNEGMIPEHVSERYDTGVEVIRRHYDARGDGDKMRVRREAYMQAIKSAMDSPSARQ